MKTIMFNQFVLLFAVIFHAQNSVAPTALNHPKFQCEIICSRAGGANEFDEDTKSCKCNIENGVDGTDIALLTKYARVVGLAPESIAPFNHSTLIIKREAEVAPESPEIAESLPTTTPEPLVGQAAPSRRPRLGPLRNRNPRPITTEQQRIILQQIRDHSTRLATLQNQPMRQLEIEAIRANLRALSDTFVHVPEVRSRFRAAAEEARRRTRMRPIRARIVGAGAPNEAETVAKEIRKIHPRFEVITQDPSLVDE